MKPPPDIHPWEAPRPAWRDPLVRLDCSEAWMRHLMATGRSLTTIRRAAP